MPAYKNGVAMKAFKGDHLPVNVYQGESKIAGFHNKRYGGSSLIGIEENGTEILGVASQVQTVQGKNLFDVNKYPQITLFQSGGNSGYLDTGADISTGGSGYYMDISAYSGQTITINHSGNRQQVAFLNEIPSLGVQVFESSIIQYSGGAKTYTIPSGYKYMWFYCNYPNVPITGIQVELGSTATAYEPFVPNSPSPDYPSDIVYSKKSGVYTITVGDKRYNLVLTEPLRQIGTVQDRLYFNTATNQAWVERNVGHKIFDGTETWYDSINYNNTYKDCYFTNIFTNAKLGYQASLCSHFGNIDGCWSTTSGKGGVIYSYGQYSDHPTLVNYKFFNWKPNTTLLEWKAWLAEQYTVGRPVTVDYQLATPKYIRIDFYEISVEENTAEYGIAGTYNDTPEVIVEGNCVQLADKYREAIAGSHEITENEEDYLRRCEVSGFTEQLSDYYAKDGLSSQVQTVQGNNICPTDFSEWESGYYTVTDGTKAIHTTRIRLKNLIRISPLTAYYFTINAIGFSFAIRTYDINGVMIASLGQKTNGSTYTTSADEYYFSVHMLKDDATVDYDIFSSLFADGTLKPFICINSETDKAYEPFVPDSPSPDYPSEVTSNLLAGTYKYTSTDGIYEFTIADDLRGIGAEVDKVVFDRVSHRGYLERRIGKKVFDGTESFATYSPYVSYTISGNKDMTGVIACVCTHYKSYSWGEVYNHAISADGKYSVGKSISAIRFYAPYTAIADFKAFLTEQYNAGTPVIVHYVLATPTRTELTFTKVASSTKTEVPMTFLTSTPSLDYPADVWSVEGNIISRGENGRTEVTLPILRKIGEVADTFNPTTGEFIKRISDWVAIDGSLVWTFIPALNPLGWKRFYVDMLNDNILGVQGTGYACKYDSSLLLNKGSSWAYINSKDAFSLYFYTDQRLAISVSNDETGFSDAYSPLVSEAKAYFNGWKMCNTDGTAPYYKSEVPYNPATWAEWIKGASITADSTGLAFYPQSEDDAFNSSIITNVKIDTKYGVLLNIVSNTLNTVLMAFGYYQQGTNIPKGTVGNYKTTFTTPSTIANNRFGYYYPVGNALGQSIKVKDIRIFELPVGSQIEADFNTMTADELCAKYTFNGLCVKNWKHVTDGLGQTAILPTASYEGYTPYKMIYQLATPVKSILTATPIPLYPGYNSYIETDTALPSGTEADVLVGYKLKSSTVPVEGDITAPTPYYPSAVNNAGECNLASRNNNLINPTNLWSYKTPELVSDWLIEQLDSYTVKVTSLKDSPSLGMYGDIAVHTGGNYAYADPYTTVTYSCEITDRSTNLIYPSSTGFGIIEGYKIFGSRVAKTITHNVAWSHGFCIRISPSNISQIKQGDYLIVRNFQIEKSAEPTLFSPQKVSLQATLPILRKIGEVADSYNPQTGEYVQRIGVKVYDGSESWVVGATGSEYIRYDSGLGYVAGDWVDYSEKYLCSHYKLGIIGTVYYATGEGIAIDGRGIGYCSTRISIKIGDKGIVDVASLKVWLNAQYISGTPLIVYYILLNPITTYLTPTPLQTFYPFTKFEQDGSIKGTIDVTAKVIN